MIDLGQRNLGLRQAIVDGVERQFPGTERHRPLAVLDMRETFVLGGSNHLAIAHQTRGGIVIGGINAKRVHAESPGRWLR